MKQARTQHGFTLVEMLLYIAVASALLGALAALFVLLLNAQSRHAALTAVAAESSYAMDVVLEHVRGAEQIVQPATSMSATTLTLTRNGSAVLFDVSGGVLRITDTDGTFPLTSGAVVVSDFTVQNVSRAETPGAVRVEFRIDTRTESARYEHNYGMDVRSGAAVR